MTYNELLNTMEWKSFRDKTIQRRGNKCEVCGEDYGGEPLHLHHKRYIKGRLPWEYEQDHMEVLCESCHHRIHRVENGFRNLIRRIPSWAAYEMEYLLEELEQLSDQSIQGWSARAKNEARNFRHNIQSNEN